MASYGICQLTMIPVRKDPAERSEMTTQLLFGETVEILDKKGSWSYVKCHLDNYKGWLTTGMLNALSADEFNKYKNAQKAFLKEPVCRVLSPETNLPVTYLAGGSTLLIHDRNQIQFGDHILSLENDAELRYPDGPVDITGTAKKYWNTPYMWGGRTIFGIDCSGFTQVVFKINGISLPRDAHQQAEMGKTVNSVEEAKPGDLAFFNREDGKIIHVGIILENQGIIHSLGRVRIDQLDHKGIYDTKLKIHLHNLRIIKRIL